MPLIAIAMRLKMEQKTLQRAADKALKSELKSKAQEVLQTAKGLIGSRSGSPSSPGSPFRSFSGRAKASLRTKVGRRAASTFVGFTPVPIMVRPATGGRRIRKINPKTGKAQKEGYANILRSGSKNMEPRPVLEPAVEQVGTRGLWKSRL